MKTIKYILSVLVLVIAFATTSCEKADNINPKAAPEVPAETLFSNAQVSLFNQVDNANINYNITRLMVQYWQQTTYFTESRYNFSGRNIPDNYSAALYRDVIMDLEEAKILLNAKELVLTPDIVQNNNQIIIADIMQVYAFQVAVDAFGDVPYTEALLGVEDIYPAYDDAATIYADLLARLTAAGSALDDSYGSYGGADFVYGGDVSLWKKFAASLKLRIGMRLADVNPTAAQAAVESAYSGVFTDASESARLFYTGVSPHLNTIYTAYFIDGRKDFIPSNTIVDLMKSLDDPRMPLYFIQVDTSTEVGVDKYVYHGAVAGLDAAQSYNNYSHFADRFFQPGFEATLIDYVETEFLLAEAAQRGWDVGGTTAEDYFNNAVKESILYWSLNTVDVADALANADAYLIANPYDDVNWKESIGTQKWLALYNRSVEAWAEWRRLDFPVLNIPTGMVYGDIPSRMPYPFKEINNNKANYEAASAAIGGDDWRTKLFWDVN